jgi:paraquat-inducible protein B
MAKTSPNPALTGAFVVGAIVLAVVSLVVFGGGKYFRSTQTWVAHFDESIKGLTVGSPVTFRGVRVGRVTEIEVMVDRQLGKVTMPVTFELEAERLTEPAGKRLGFLKPAEGTKRLIETGLRAQLEIESLVTGQLAINLDMYPESPLALVRTLDSRLKQGGETEGQYPEMPTIPSKAAALGRSIEALDIPDLVADLKKTVAGVERLVNAPEVRAAVVNASAMMQDAQKLMTATNQRMATLGPALERTAVTLDGTLIEVRKVAQGLDQRALPAATDSLQDLRQVLRRLDGETLAAANRLLGNLDDVARQVSADTVPAATETLRGVGQVARQLNAETLPAAAGMLQDVGQAARTLDAETLPVANRFLTDAGRVAQKLDAETVPAANQLLADVRQVALRFEGAAEAGRLALVEVQRVAASVDVDSESPLRYQLDVTLREVTSAARAFRALASYLERQPNAVLVGKPGK